MTTTKTKIAGGAAMAGAALLVLSGCSFTEQEPENVAFTLDGEYVYAPVASEATDSSDDSEGIAADESGKLFVLNATDRRVEVVLQHCATDAEGRGVVSTDARQTAFGEIGETTDETSAPITWIEGGGFTVGDAGDVAVLSDGEIVNVAGSNFFRADSNQGAALTEQFTAECEALTVDEVSDDEDEIADEDSDADELDTDSPKGVDPDRINPDGTPKTDDND